MKRSLSLFMLILFGVVACHAPRPLMTPAEVERWITTYSPERIAADSNIEIQFNEPLGADSVSVARGVFDISPRVRGKAHWRNGGTTLVFEPREGALKEGRTYDVRIDMSKITGQDDIGDFGFTIHVAEKKSQILIGKVSSSNAERAVVEGTIVLSEPVDPEAMTEELITSSISDNTTEVSITGGGDTYEFQITGLKRSQDDTEATITFHADCIGFGQAQSEQVFIPGQGEFKVLSVENSDAVTPYIDIEFSDALDQNQDLDGLIVIDKIHSVDIQRVSPTNVRVLYDDSGISSLTLKIGAEVRSADGRRLNSEFEKEISTKAIPPAVEIPLSGTILPDAQNLVLPFKAVNLAAVDVQVVRIYESNVLSFLHDNELDGGYRLRRVGKLVFRQTVRLDTDKNLDLHKWQNFSVDLSGLFRQERGAIYRIKLSFKRDYSMYDRTPGNIEILSGVEDADDEVWMDEPFDWDDWDWDERNDPAKASYYMSDERFPEYNLMASNIGLVVKGAGNGKLWTSVTDILSARPMEGVNVTAYSYQLKQIGQGTTDGNGFADFNVAGRPFVVTASKGGATSYLKVEPGYANSLSRFDVGGKEAARGIKGFIYGERGVWRPGDTVHLTLVVEDRNHILPANHPVTMEIHTPQGQFFDRQTLSKGVDGFYTFSVVTSDDSPTGTWNASFKVGGEMFNKSVRIETIKPNRLKINITTQGDMLQAGREAVLDVESHWLTGPPAAGLETTIEMTLRRHPQPFGQYKDYNFLNPLISFASETYDFAKTRLDDNGKTSIRKTMASSDDAPGMLIADLICRVEEPGGDVSIVSHTMDYSPYDAYVGINLGEAEFETDKDLSFPVMAVDARGHKLSGRMLAYKVYKLEWSWWWEYSAAKLNSYVHGTSADVVAQGKMTTDANGAASVPFRIDYPSWGKYLVLVSDDRGRHATGGMIYVDWPSWRGHSDKGDPSAISMLAFTLDKDSYEVGEQATVYIPAAEGGRALVSVENSSGVISRTWVQTAAGKETAYKLDVTRDMSPNCYINITLLQPHRQTANDLPIRMYGVQPMVVTNKASHITPEIKVPDVVRPQEEFTVKVSEKQGKPMTYTLAIVDEGLLDITNFRTPDLWGAMNQREALGVKTWDLYDDVVGAYGGRWSRVLSIGGDEALNSGTQKEKRFNPVVKFLGPFTLARGSKTHKITLPMYVGSVKVMVVAGKNGTYGSADKTVTVRSPLMVLSTLPRQLSNGEKVSMPVNVFALEDGVRSADVSIKVEGPLRISGSASRKLSFSKPSDQLVDFVLESDARDEGMARVTITAKGNGYTASEVVNIEVRNPNPPTITSTTKMLEGGKTCDFSWQQADEARLEVATFPAIDFAGTFEFTRYYMHLCTEQLSSRGFNLLYARRFLDEKSAKQAEQMLPLILKELYGRQLSGGGFCYWPGDGRPHDWASSMAGQLLTDAQAQGFPVSQQVLSRWLEYQQKAAREYRYAADSDLQQAYRLYTLALSKSPNQGAMNKLRETSSLSAQARWRLAAAYAMAGRREVASQVLASATNPPAKISYATFGSPLRDRAMMMETQVLAGDTSSALITAAEVAREFSSSYCSTNEVAFVSLAMSRLADVVSTKVDGVKFNQTGSDSRTILSPKSVADYELDPSKRRLHVENLSKGQVSVNLMLKSKPLPGTSIAEVSEGVSVGVRYTDLKGNEIGIFKMQQGQELVANIVVSERTGMTNSPSMALTFVAPSGWEIWNERMAGQEDKSDDYTYKDIRDDRVSWYFSLGAGRQKSFSVRLRAAYAGVFALPPVVCADMYNPRYRAGTTNTTVEITK